MKLLVEMLNDGNLLEACHRIDKENVVIIQLVPTKVGFNARVQIGLHEYGGNMVSHAYDHALVEFFAEASDLHIKLTIDRGYIKDGDYQSFLRMRPTEVHIHNMIYQLEYANDAVTAE